MRIFNINSKITPDIELVKKYISLGFVFNKILKNIDIFIVDEKLMDVINHPVDEPEPSCAYELIRYNANQISALRHPVEVSIDKIFADENDKR